MFRFTNLFASNLNTINLKLFRNLGGIYRFEKIFEKYSGEISLLGVHRNVGWCFVEVNFEELGW